MSELSERIQRILPGLFGPSVTLQKLSLLSGGACQENYRLDLEVEGIAQTLVLRSDAPSSLSGSIGRAQEYAVVAASYARGVRTPRPTHLRQGYVREGAFGYLLDWANGEAIGRFGNLAPELAEARLRLGAELGAELAKIHAIHPGNAETLMSALGPAPTDPIQSALKLQRSRIDALKTRRLGTELIYRWLVDHAPAGHASVLLHGDFRTGNFLVSPSGLTAVLDWEFARWGSSYEDLAWISLRDWRFGVLDKPIGGFESRSSFYAAYEQAGGLAVDMKAVHYFEVLGNLAWAVGSIAQAERYTRHGEKELELLAIGRRAAEMEWEALRLIKQGSV
jgi:aminoglycoside phosphotransferase (APT) family kinase protein